MAVDLPSVCDSCDTRNLSQPLSERKRGREGRERDAKKELRRDETERRYRQSGNARSRVREARKRMKRASRGGRTS